MAHGRNPVGLFLLPLLSMGEFVLCVLEGGRIMSDEKTVTCLQGNEHEKETAVRVITAEELRAEFAYELATDLLRQMLEKGIITQGEFNKIDAKNRASFSPHLAELMP